VVELTGLERMVVLINHVLRRKPLLLTNRKPQLQLQHRLLLMLHQDVLPACRQLQIFGILQLNMQVELQVRTNTHLRAVQTSVKKITEPVNKDLFSNQSVTLSMQRQRPNNGRRSERRLMLRSAVAECLMLRNF
jgi:hypothetical protein